MKKSVLIAVLGVAASVATSYGQGKVGFTSYYSNNGAGNYTYNFGSATAVADGMHADLYYALGTVSDPVNNASMSSVSALPSGMIDLGFTDVYHGGFFGYPNINVALIPGYVTGNCTFEVVAYSGASYGSSLIRGRSGSFTMSKLAVAPTDPLPNLGNNGMIFPTMYVAAVPEPTTLALAGFGGLAALVALRRKQS